MKRSISENYEEINLVSFIETLTHKLDVEVTTATITVPFNTSQFAISAMLKGFYEYFLLEAEKENFDKDLLNKIEHNLEVYRKKLNVPEKESSLILTP